MLLPQDLREWVPGYDMAHFDWGSHLCCVTCGTTHDESCAWGEIASLAPGSALDAPNMRLSFRKIHCRGFTLIEVMLAIAIAVLVTSVAFMTYRMASNTSRGIFRNRSSSLRVLSALETLRRDMACAVGSQVPGTDVFVVDPGGPAEPRFSMAAFYTVSAGNAADGGSRFVVHRVVYRVTESDAGMELIRATKLLGEDGLGEEERQSVVSGLLSFQISVNWKGDWYDRWPIKGSPRIPSGARLLIGAGRPGSEVRLESETLVNTGLEF